MQFKNYIHYNYIHYIYTLAGCVLCSDDQTAAFFCFLFCMPSQKAQEFRLPFSPRLLTKEEWYDFLVSIEIRITQETNEGSAAFGSMECVYFKHGIYKF